MSLIIEGGPDERRRYLNLALAQAAPSYGRALTEYAQAISQRNALLKLINERGGDPGQLVYWDDVISRTGAFIMLERIQALRELERLAARIHHRLTRSTEVLRLNYLPAYEPLPRPDGQIALPISTSLDRSKITLEEIRDGFLQRLKQVRNEEISRGVTTIGPHRDELRFLANSMDLGDYGSRGQIRTALLALKLAEVEWMRTRTGQWPVILLDEVLAELDPHRRDDLLTHLGESEQSLLTTTDLALFNPDFVAGATRWEVSGGGILTPVCKKYK
jgi:DNA replication and repair protein RecF